MCETFVSPQKERWDPYNLLVDESKDTIYVTDFSDSNIRIFSISNRTDQGKLGRTIGDSNLPSGLAVRPGMHQLASTAVFPVDHMVAGEKITVELHLADWSNEKLVFEDTESYSLLRYCLEAKAVLNINGIQTDIVIDGNLYLAPTPSTGEIGVFGDIVLRKAGQWEIDLHEGNDPTQSFYNSPRTMQVLPSASSGLNSRFTVDSLFIRAGEDFVGSVHLVDEYSNPTNDNEDQVFLHIHTTNVDIRNPISSPETIDLMISQMIR